MNSFKFRLSNLQELEKHDCLDELITDNTVPDDFEKTPFNKDQLVLTKSDIGNIVNTFQDSILNYVKSAREELSSKDENTLIINDTKSHDQNNDLLIETRNSDMNNLKIRSSKSNNRPSKEKKLKKRKSKSIKIHHV